MDVQFFLQQRTKFIREFYDQAAAPFLEIKRKIEAEEPPYEPPYSEDGEPPFLEEWLHADTSVEVLGRACVSMLSETLKLYFATWERELGQNFQISHPSEFGKDGFVRGYLRCFNETLGIEYPSPTVDLDLLEQVVHARNDSQHGQAITSLEVAHRGSLKRTGRRIFFARDSETTAAVDTESSHAFSMTPYLHITREKLFQAIAAIELFVTGMEERFLRVRGG